VQVFAFFASSVAKSLYKGRLCLELKTPYPSLTLTTMSSNKPLTKRILSKIRRLSRGSEQDSRDEQSQRRALLVDTSHGSRSYGGVHSSPLEIHYEEDDGLFDNDQRSEHGPVYHGGASLMAGDTDDEEDWEMEQQGMYRGSYRRTLLLYCIVPSFSLLCLILLALVPPVFYPQLPSKPRPAIPYLPYPLPELFLSICLWSFSHILRVPLFIVASAVTPSTYPSLTTIFFAFLTAVLTNTLRLMALPFLRLSVTYHPTTTEPAFRSVWWFALAWAAADVVVGIYQGFEAITLYKDAFVEAKLGADHPSVDEEIALNGKRPSQQSSLPRRQESLSPVTAYSSQHVPDSHHRYDSERPSGDGPSSDLPATLNGAMNSQQSLGDVLEHDFEQLLALERREELEEIYGMPFIRIPVFISCLLRMDSLFATTGFTLLTSAAYLSYTAVLTPTTPHLNFPVPSFILNYTPPFFSISSSHDPLFPLAVTLPVVIVVHTLLSSLSMAPFLSRIGVQTAGYVGAFVGLAAFFAGLGMWEAVS
jgi:hypothetical protein